MGMRSHCAVQGMIPSPFHGQRALQVTPFYQSRDGQQMALPGAPCQVGWVISHPCCLPRGAGQWRRETRSPLQVKAAKCISIEMEGGGPNQHQAQEQAPFPNPTQREGELSL